MKFLETIAVTTKNSKEIMIHMSRTTVRNNRIWMLFTMFRGGGGYFIFPFVNMFLVVAVRITIKRNF